MNGAKIKSIVTQNTIQRLSSIFSKLIRTPPFVPHGISLTCIITKVPNELYMIFVIQDLRLEMEMGNPLSLEMNKSHQICLKGHLNGLKVRYQRHFQMKT